LTAEEFRARLSETRIRLGHIAYSNCFPVHARLIDQPRGDDPSLVYGVPSRLNELLAAEKIDVAPCSSIEYALHSQRYKVLPDLVIGSRGPVRSILLLADTEPERLGSATVAIPTASATSVVLLKILLQTRWGVRPRFQWFDQASEDPFENGAKAALFIGDVALRPDLFTDKEIRLDLGSEWYAETGLPFAFAIWQSSSRLIEPVRLLHRTLLESRTFGVDNRVSLADRYASDFGLSAMEMVRYWSDLSYELDADMLQGLNTFFRLAADIGEILSPPPLRWID